MLVESILSGIQVISSISSILRGLEQKQHNKELAKALRQINVRIALLQKHIDELDVMSDAPPRLLSRYNNLVNIARDEGIFDRYLRFCRTDKGTWIVKRRRKRSVLRDPHGEY